MAMNQSIDQKVRPFTESDQWLKIEIAGQELSIGIKLIDMN